MKAHAMTDSDIQKLKAIRAKCEELLEIAAKRTPGEWQWVDPETDEPIDFAAEDARLIESARKDYIGQASLRTVEIHQGEWAALPEFIAETEELPKATAQFIAACAGAAEAGWRATIAAIDSLPTIVRQAERIKRIRWGYDGDCGADGLACDCEDFANDAIKSILTAWEGLV